MPMLIFHLYWDFLISFFSIMSMGANDTRGMANLDPRILIGRIYVGDH